MLGSQFLTTAVYADNEIEFGFPIQLIISTDKPTFMQFIRRVKQTEKQRDDKAVQHASTDISSRLTWDIAEVPFPAGDFVFDECHGVRIKTNGGAAANVYVIQVQQEDPKIRTFNPST